MNVQVVRWGVTLLIALASVCPVVAAPAAMSALLGQAHVQRYRAGDYPGNPRNWAIATDTAGRVHVANGIGVMRFEAGQWRLSKVAQGARIRSLLATDRRVYVGLDDAFGYLEDDALGTAQYTELFRSNSTTPAGGAIGEVDDLCPVGDGLLAAGQRVVRVKNGNVSPVLPDNVRLTRAACIDNALIATDQDGAVWRFDGSGRQRIVGEVPAMGGALSLPDGRVLLTSEKGGLQIITGDHIEPWQNAWAARMTASGPCSVVAAPGGRILVGTAAGDLYWLSPALDVVRMQHVADYTLLSMAIDREGSVWIAAESEVLRIPAEPAWNLFTGLHGWLLDFAETPDGFVVASSGGLYIARAEGAGATALTVEPAHSRAVVGGVAVTPWGLLAARIAGISAGPPGAMRALVTEADRRVAVLPASGRDDLWYVLESQDIRLLQRVGDGWDASRTIALTGMRFGPGRVLDDEGHWWVGSFNGPPIRLTFSADGLSLVAAERMSAGVDPTAPMPALMTYHGHLFSLKNEQPVVWDDNRFRAADAREGLPAALADGPLLRAMTCGGRRDYAHSGTRLFERLTDAQEWRELPLEQGGIGYIADSRCGSDGSLFVVSESGVNQLLPEHLPPPAPPRETEIVSVSLQPRDGDAHRLAIAPASPLALPPLRSLHFDYAVPTGDRTLRYQTRLMGWSPAWTAEDARASQDYFDLEPGDYVFEARGVAFEGARIAPVAWPFTVLPTWYEHPLTRFAFATLVVLALVAGVRWRLSRLRAANLALEARIAERTADLSRSNEQLATMARQDALTGLANRRRVEHFLDEQFATSVTSDTPLSVIAVDLDHFKRLNDRFGHAAGDERLKAVADVLRAAIDPERELAGRIGGEEFILVLPSCPLDEAGVRAQRLLASLAGVDPAGDRVTVSIGVAERVASNSPDSAALMSHADVQLYLAKNAGRDRVNGISQIG